MGEFKGRSSPIYRPSDSPASCRYQHPGYAFIHRYGSLQTEADVFHYVDFLRDHAGLKVDSSHRHPVDLPIDLEKIYQAFGMPIPLRVPLDHDQQGILLNSATGMILIREGDPIVRQRFTEGHELMELLFDAQADVAAELNLTLWSEARKEKLCDAGAAELLMPRALFCRHIQHLGISMTTARSLSQIYHTSLIATLIRMVTLTQEARAIALWKPWESGWQLEWSGVSDTWTEGLLPRGLRVMDWTLNRSRLARVQRSQVTLPLRSGLRSVGAETLGIGSGSRAGLLALLRC